MDSKVNMQYLSDEYFADHNREKREWYTKFVNNYYTELEHQVAWRKYVYANNIYMTFFEWYEILICKPQGIDNPFLKVYQTPKVTQSYKDVKTNKYIISIHPPKSPIFIQDNYLAIPLVTGQDIVKDDSSPKELVKDIIYQNNYSNEILNTMSQQLNRIEGNQNKEIKIEQGNSLTSSKP